MSAVAVQPIGWVRGGRSQAEDDDWGDSVARIELDATRFGPDALAGLDAFSHAEIIFLFDKADDGAIVSGARHPRGLTHLPKVGIFAQRGKDRPNHLGLTTCAILGVEGDALLVRGLDAIDGTPVLDIKPVMLAFQPRGDLREPAWVAQIMKDYW